MKNLSEENLIGSTKNKKSKKVKIMNSLSMIYNWKQYKSEENIIGSKDNIIGSMIYNWKYSLSEENIIGSMIYNWKQQKI